MKKFVSLVCVFVLSVNLITVAVNAADIEAVPLGICAVVSDREGKKSIKSAEVIEKPGSFQSYTLYIDREPVLSVDEQNSELIATGASVPSFYHTEFNLPETTLLVYLTGLRSENVEELQQKIIDSISQDKSFELSDLSFIDTEKTAFSDGDEQLCWAAASSNILYYTGWGSKAGFSDEDELFDLFVSSFTDSGSHQENAMAWFFNRAALQNNTFTLGASQIRRYPNSGGYCRDYAYDMVSNYSYIRTPTDMNNIYQLLRQGYGISPGINLQSAGNTTGSHAVTLWGMVIDLSKTSADAKRYHGIFISDSDSHMIYDSDRRKASKVLSYFPLAVNKWNYFYFNYKEDLTATLDDYEFLAPYSKDLPRETDTTCGRDKARYPDLTLREAYLTNKPYTPSSETLFESGTDLYIEYAVASVADKAWRTPIKTKRSIVNSAGKEVFNDIDSISVSYLSGLKYIQSTETQSKSLPRLPAGDYTVTYTINPTHSPTEAYYYNNTYSFDFYIRDSYMRGDYDNNSQIELIDATLIQRHLSQLFTDTDNKVEERCDFDENGLDITDAAWIMRDLAAIKTPYPIGEKALYREA